MADTLFLTQVITYLYPPGESYFVKTGRSPQQVVLDHTCRQCDIVCDPVGLCHVILTSDRLPCFVLLAITLSTQKTPKVGLFLGQRQRLGATHSRMGTGMVVVTLTRPTTIGLVAVTVLFSGAVHYVVASVACCTTWHRSTGILYNNHP